MKSYESTVQELRGQLMNKQEIVVGDQTGTITLTLWDQLVSQEILIGHSYNIENVSTRIKNGKKTLTTTKQTIISEAEVEIQEVKHTNDLDETVNVEARVLNVCIKSSMMCPSCKQKITLQSASAYVRCSQCGMKHKVSALCSSLIGTINFQRIDNQAMLKLTAFNSVLVNYLIKEQKEDLKNDVDSFENFLLDQEKIRVHYSPDEKVITNMDTVRQ